MTSAATGLPDRYRPLDQLGPDEPTATGAIRSWRAKDRVLNRDVAIRVHSPGGRAAHTWIARALTAGGLATPALAMVYDAAEGSDDAGPDAQGAPGSAAYVVNEWIEGETLAERLRRGPLPQREARSIIRRLAEGVAEAHRVGLAVGGLTPEHVVLRPGGLVGLRAVPAASGTVQGDITALGALLEACLGGRQAVEAAGRVTRRASVPAVPPDLAALVRRARSTEPGQGLSSAAAMASLLAERPRAGSSGAPAPRDLPTVPPVPSPPPSPAAQPPTREVPAQQPPPAGSGLPGPGRPAPPSPWSGPGDDLDSVLPRGDGEYGADADDDTDDDTDDTGYGTRYGTGGGRAEHGGTEESGARRKLVVVGLPALALALVIALAWWLGSSVLSVADSVSDGAASTPPASSAAGSGTAASGTAGSGTAGSSAPPVAGAPARIVAGQVFDPQGDGQPENDDDVPRSFDGDPSTSWSTLDYRGSPAFGNLKSGVGVVYDLGTTQPLSGVTITTSTPGATVEVRTGARADGSLDSFAVAASATLQRSTELTFRQPVSARYVLVWVTGLVPDGAGYAADLAEVAVRTAG